MKFKESPKEMPRHLQSIEIYRCASCDKAFNGPPGPIRCKYCGHKFVTWLNYEQFQRWYDLQEEK